jgi:ParB family chromosome partitioning protein
MAPSASKPVSGAKKLLSLPLADVLPDPEQPRKYFDLEALNELKTSIEQHGIIQPVLVRPSEDGKYIIVAGERRHRAATIKGGVDYLGNLGLE